MSFLKKRIRITIVCITVIAAVVIAAFSVNRFVMPILHTTLKPAATTEAPSSREETKTTAVQTTTKATTAASKNETTVPVSQKETVIDIDNLTIIDLFPFSLASGDWNVRHCQGIAVDKNKGYIYYSYTTLLVKCDMDGNIIGTVTGFTGHLGDIAFNEKDRKIYCGYFSENAKGLYIVIFDADKITKTDMSCTDKNLVRTVHVEEAWKDFRADANGNGKFDGAGIYSPDHRYGCTGIDAVEFGPSFLNPSKKNYLTVGYGITPNAERTDNNYQVLLQYDVTDWWKKYGQPYSKTENHRIGPEKCNGKFFVYTGSTTHGTQTIAYFKEMNIWLLNCYAGVKSEYENFTMFAVDGDVKPKIELIKGQPTPTVGYVLSLYQDGEYDKKNGIYGWHSRYGQKGMAYLSDGLFYVVSAYKLWTGTQTAICYLNIWDPENGSPLSLAAGVGTNFSISKKKRTETPTENKSVKDLIPEGTEYINELLSISR